MSDTYTQALYKWGNRGMFLVLRVVDCGRVSYTIQRMRDFSDVIQGSWGTCDKFLRDKYNVGMPDKGIFDKIRRDLL